MVVASLVKITLSDPSAVLGVMLKASSSGVTLALTLAGIYIVWMGIIQVAVDAGVIDALGRAMAPVMRFLIRTLTMEPPRPTTFWEYSMTL